MVACRTKKKCFSNIDVEIRADVMAEIKQEEAKSNITVVENRHKCRINNSIGFFLK